MKFHLLLGFFFVMSLAEDTEAGTFDSNACRAFKATATADSNFRYVTHGTHCYLFSKTEKHWTKAREFCKQKGADLVAINDEAENAFVHNMFHGDMSVPDYIAIGALYDASLGWHWVSNNEKITFSKWDGGAVPEHVGSSKYGAMYNTKESWGHWGDDNEPFVCEETAPDPCFGVNCLNGGVCKDGNCFCTNSYTGVHCEKAPDPCCSVKCQNGGKCENGNCNCVNGYTGARCESAGWTNGNPTVAIDGRTYILIQRRTNVSASAELFNADWQHYKNGFGSPDGLAFWLGLEKMYQATKTGRWELLFMAKHYLLYKNFYPNGQYAGKWGYQIFEKFRIYDEAQGYRLSLGNPFETRDSSSSGQMIKHWHWAKFSTKDKDNISNGRSHCAKDLKVGWWFHSLCRKTDNFNYKEVNFHPSLSTQTLMAMRPRPDDLGKDLKSN